MVAPVATDHQSRNGRHAPSWPRLWRGRHAWSGGDRMVTAPPTRSLAAIGLVLFAMFLFSSTDAMAKWLVAGYSIFQIFLFRGLLSLALLTPILVRRHGVAAAFRTGHLGVQLLRGGFGALSLGAFVLALQTVPLAEASALGFSGSLMLTALSALVLKEKVGVKRWIAVTTGFLGVLIIVQPGTSAFQPASLLVLLSSFSYASMMIATRWLTRTEGNVSMVFYHSTVAAALGCIVVPFVWVTPNGLDLVLLIATGLAGTFGHLALTQAYRNAAVATLAPFDYSALVWVTLLGFAVWGDVPGPLVWLGAAVIVGAGLYVVHGERAAGRV
ncbi:MAG: DMT family transporter [Alphaproteobacteria bacterium]|nr:DMT family transporter [Alphaproteobacteria bacterium]